MGVTVVTTECDGVNDGARLENWIAEPSGAFSVGGGFNCGGAARIVTGASVDGALDAAAAAAAAGTVLDEAPAVGAEAVAAAVGAAAAGAAPGLRSTTMLVLGSLMTMAARFAGAGAGGAATGAAAPGPMEGTPGAIPGGMVGYRT